MDIENKTGKGDSFVLRVKERVPPQSRGPELSCYKDDTGCCLLQLGGYQYKYLKVSESI